MANIYEAILPLEEVKNHLRVNVSFTEDDPAIERMISSALQFIEAQTNHIFLATDKTYQRNLFSNDIDIYDYPINTTEFGDNIPLNYSSMVKFCGVDSITLNVGYGSRSKVPTALIECALAMIETWYYEAEKKANTTLIPEHVKEVINSYKRAVIMC